MTPYELTLLIHFRTTPERFPQSETDLYINTTERFEREDLIEVSSETDNQHGYELTKLGVAWLAVILNTPKPKLVYVDYKGDQVSAL